MIGRTLSHYNILEKIGSGGMGEVYVAEDTKLSRKIALKVLPPEMAESEERRSRFEREAKTIAALNHPTIVTVHSVEEVDGVHFITMELVRGKTLSEILPKHGIALNKFFDIAVPLADAVAAAHQEGITHRDLKPDNVMVSDEGRVKVLDFGLAKPQKAFASEGTGSDLDTEHMTQEGRILGTLNYMSPEQAEGKTVDHRSDIFSLGILFYEMLTGQRVRETLAMMGRSGDERITKALGQELCQREGVKAMLTGSIAGLGSTYAITLEANHCQTGESLAAEQVEAGSKDEVLTALGAAASALRRKLGESLASIEQLDAPIERATTASLEALKAYSLAEIERANASSLTAIPLYKRAVELDPNFALAHARLGTVYGNAGERNLSREHRTKAFELRDRVSELEKLYITAHHYYSVTGEIDKGVETYELWKKTYPRDWSPYNNLAVHYQRIGRYDKAVEEAREALRLEPNHSLPYTNLGWSYIFLDRLDEAAAIFREAEEHQVDQSGTHDGLYWIAFLQDDPAAMDREVEWARGTPGEPSMLGLVAAVKGQAGKLGEARELRETAGELARRSGLRDVAAGYVLNQAVLEAAYGNSRQAREALADAIEIQGSEMPRGRASLTLALLGDVAGASAQAEALVASRPSTDTFFHEGDVPQMQAAIALARGEPARAIEQLEPARAYEIGEFPSWILLLRGRAYLASGSASKASAELQKILDHPQLFQASEIFPLALLGLARAQAEAGDVDAARRAYQDLLALWKDADADLPVLEQAKAEYARLGS